MSNTYEPEGYLTHSEAARNRELCATVAGLEYALIHDMILEAPVTLCDGNFNLHFNLGECRGVMYREDVMFCRDNEKIKDIAILTRVGKNTCFKVIGFEKINGRLTARLSRREAQRECFENYLIKLCPGDIIPAKVTHMENFGAFVDIGCGLVSLLSVDCISVSRISHPKDRLECGMNIMTVVKSIDYTTGKIYVTHRELLGTWEENAACFAPGQTVAGIIRSIEQYGIFIELAPNLAGLAEIRDGSELHGLIEVGQQAAVYIKSIIPERMKIKLVLIDIHKPTISISRPQYFIETDKIRHMDRWKYSPDCSVRIIETVFD